MTPFDLVEPRSLEEAFSLLGGDDPAVRPISGGTALLLMMKAQVFRPVRLVSLRHLGTPFRGVSLDDGAASLRIGAMTSFSTLEHSDVIQRHFPVVARAMRSLANVRVRNVATVGGNLAHADPHLDLPPVWIALAAQTVILSPSGERVVPIEDLFEGYYETILQHDDIIAELRVPLRASWRTVYFKVTTRVVHDWPTIGIAVSLEIEGARIKDARVVLSAAIDKPTRLVETEAVLRGATIDEKTLRSAGEAATAEVHIESDDHGSSAYKQHLLRVYLGRAVQAVAQEHN